MSNIDQDSDDPCTLCRHNHANKDCYKQHPERAPESWYKGEAGKGHYHGKAAISISKNFDTSDEDDRFYIKPAKRSKERKLEGLQ
ncbi:hypothetical protein GcC1_127025 [Golovinomyces cichoracearum]|uniref:Uncharacterized protein n=1 Tax=Golovinomyces cichoracearum TaxID=62708 RepID=A0A420I5G4_9PEZI|nr:hypothetical protein GcC1_127025 [Golovinomyces cichoracearum]